MASSTPTEKVEKRAEKSPAEKPAAEPAPARPEEPSPLVIERLTHEDVADIVQLFRRVWEPYLNGLPAEVQRAWQPTPLEFTSGMEGVTYFAAKRNNRLIGVVGCEMKSASCQLLNLCVDAEHRRRGIGTALLAAAVGWAQHANARSMYIDVLHRFTEAQALFRANGFKESGVLHRHFWGEDVRMYEKLL